MERGGVDRNLVGAFGENQLHVFERAYAAAHAKGNKHALGDVLHEIDDDCAAVRRRRDVEKHQFVGALAVIRFSARRSASPASRRFTRV